MRKCQFQNRDVNSRGPQEKEKFVEKRRKTWWKKKKKKDFSFIQFEWGVGPARECVAPFSDDRKRRKKDREREKKS